MTGSPSDTTDEYKNKSTAQLEKQTLERRFKDPADPLKVVIVRDMTMTACDAPYWNTMYLDKQMKGRITQHKPCPTE